MIVLQLQAGCSRLPRRECRRQSQYGCEQESHYFHRQSIWFYMYFSVTLSVDDDTIDKSGKKTGFGFQPLYLNSFGTVFLAFLVDVINDNVSRFSPKISFL